MVVAADIAASLGYPGYSYVDYSVSELSAVGAPKRPFVTGVDLLTILLELAFAVGVWLAAPGQRGLRIAAVLLFAHAAMNLALGLVNPTTDTLHLVYAAVTAVLLLTSSAAPGQSTAAPRRCTDGIPPQTSQRGTSLPAQSERSGTRPRPAGGGRAPRAD